MDAKSQWLSIILIASSLGCLGGWFAAHQQLQQPIARLNLVTPVFVLDRAKLIQSIPPNASQDIMAKIVDDWQSQARKLSDAGHRFHLRGGCARRFIHSTWTVSL